MKTSEKLTILWVWTNELAPELDRRFGRLKDPMDCKADLRTDAFLQAAPWMIAQLEAGSVRAGQERALWVKLLIKAFYWQVRSNQRQGTRHADALVLKALADQRRRDTAIDVDSRRDQFLGLWETLCPETRALIQLIVRGCTVSVIREFLGVKKSATHTRIRNAVDEVRIASGLPPLEEGRRLPSLFKASRNRKAKRPERQDDVECREAIAEMKLTINESDLIAVLIA